MREQPAVRFPHLLAVLTVAIGLILAASPAAHATYVPDKGFGNRGVAEGKLGSAKLPALVPSKAVVRDQRGRILYAVGNENAWKVRRYLVNGTLDPSFGDRGSVLVDSWGLYNPGFDRATVTAMKVRRNGRILLVGFLDGDREISNPTDSITAFKQLLPNGEPDPAFGQVQGGIAIPGFRQAPISFSILRDGRILTAGFGGLSSRTKGFVRRFLPDGRFDKSYKKITIGDRPGKNSVLLDMDRLPDGRILVGGTKDNQYTVMMLRPDGSLARSFGKGGKIVTSAASGGCRCELGTALARDGKGRILITGYVQPPETEDRIYGSTIRLKKTGKLDRSFGWDGRVRLFSGRSARLLDIGLDAKRGIWVTGSGGPEFGKRKVIARRYFQDGRIDLRTTKAIRVASRLGDNSRGYAILRAKRSIFLAGKSIRDEFEYSFVKKFVPRPRGRG